LVETGFGRQETHCLSGTIVIDGAVPGDRRDALTVVAHITGVTIRVAATALDAPISGHHVEIEEDHVEPALTRHQLIRAGIQRKTITNEWLILTHIVCAVKRPGKRILSPGEREIRQVHGHRIAVWQCSGRTAALDTRAEEGEGFFSGPGIIRDHTAIWKSGFGRALHIAGRMCLTQRPQEP